MIAFVLAASLLQAAGCKPVESDHIYGRDLAGAVPALQSLPAGMDLGYAPIPGQQRVFRPEQLRRIANEYHLNPDIRDGVCFAWPTTILSRQDMIAAMQAALKTANPQIEIISQSLAPAPPGSMIFPLSGLSGISDTAVVWRGYVVYAGDHRFPVWARARITVSGQRVVASDVLRPGEPIRIEQLRTEQYTGPIWRGTPFSKVSDAVGMVPRNNIQPGAVVTENLVEEPREVERGELVEALVQVDSTRIETQGVAEQGGRLGAIITVRNPKSGRKFRARIEGKSKVVVVPGGAIELATEDQKS